MRQLQMSDKSTEPDGIKSQREREVSPFKPLMLCSLFQFERISFGSTTLTTIPFNKLSFNNGSFPKDTSQINVRVNVAFGIVFTVAWAASELRDKIETKSTHESLYLIKVGKWGCGISWEDKLKWNHNNTWYIPEIQLTHFHALTKFQYNLQNPKNGEYE